MADMLCKTRGNANPKGKPRVYFTCHPADFELYFHKLCQDIFKAQDCAIYYTQDMTQVIQEQDKSTDLECHNLFIVPVTFRLLTQPNRAMDFDIPYALQKHIPVLPFLMETGIDHYYAAKFGELQYLNPCSTDDTEISYEEKLKKHLDSVLISDQLAARIRAAFDAYIFLSYRKKDRSYANQLMRLIHSRPECRDIAIWYDEFLSPGESFRENIEKILGNSKLFTLLVTPNLLEEPDGKPNFVMGEEYPAAKRSGIDILPTEMVVTEKGALHQKFADLPACVKPGDEVFYARLLETVSRLAITTNDRDPMHNFLIGLAYLEGIDMETNRERGLALITDAAEQDLPEAMKKLFNMYHQGSHVPLSYAQAANWAQRLAEYYEKQHGPEHSDTLNWQNNFALMLAKLGDYKKSLQLKEKCYAAFCKLMGETHPDTLTALSNLAVGYAYVDDPQTALTLEEKAFSLRSEALGSEHPDTLCSMNNMAKTHQTLKNYPKALALFESVYALRCKILGTEHPRTLSALQNLASICSDMGNHRQAAALLTKAHATACALFGEEHPESLTALNDLALTLGDLGDLEKALALNEKLYNLRTKVLGENHPETLHALSNLASSYGALGEFHTTLELFERAYDVSCQVLGQEHPDTLVILNNITLAYSCLKEHYKEATTLKTLYDLQCRVLGKNNPRTQKTEDRFEILYRSFNLCRHCGGKLKGLFQKKCTLCGKAKDY